MQEIHIPARHGRSFAVRAGQYVSVIAVQGPQVGDFIAFNAHDMTETVCVARTRHMLKRIYLRVDDSLYTNLINPALRIVRDDVGAHDLTRPYCTARRYEVLSGLYNHRSCQDNFVEALAQYEIPGWRVPHPLNIFQNSPILADGSLIHHESKAKPGDRIVFQAVMDLVAAVSACPADDNPVNGYQPKELLVQVSDEPPA